MRMDELAPVPSGPRIARYKGGPFWAVWDEQGQLVCVCVYKKGANALVERLTYLARRISDPPVMDLDPFWDPNLAAALSPTARASQA